MVFRAGASGNGYPGGMSITLKLPDSVEAELRAEAANRGVSLEELAIERIVAGAESETPRRVRRIRVSPRGSGHTDTAERAEELLGEGFEGVR